MDENITFLFLCLGGMLMLILGTILGVLVYSGMLHNIVICAGQPPICSQGFTVAYKFIQGPYNDNGYTFTEATSIEPNLKAFGVYYDDPKTVPGEKCRAGIGCILSEGEQATDPTVKAAYQAKGYHFFAFPAITSAVYTYFPYRNSISILLGTFRVYPALCAYIMRKLCGHPFLEIYDGRRINFIVPLARQGDYYLPQTQEIKENGHAEDEQSANKTIDENCEKQTEELSASLRSKSYLLQ